MNEVIRLALADRLRRPVSRRAFLGGVGGAVTLTVLGGGALAACGSDKAGGTRGLGGSLNFFGFDGEDGQDIAKPFLDENKIKLQSSYQSALDEGLTRFKTGGKGSLDLLTPNKDFQRFVLHSGIELFQALDMDKLPNAAGLFPTFKDASWLSRDGKTYGIPLIWGNTPCVYNPAKWDGVPDKYTDFADPKYAGELCMLDDPFGIIWMYAASAGIADPSRLTAAQLDTAIEELKKVKPNIVTFCASYGDMGDVLVRGDASMAIGGWAYLINMAAEKGVTLAAAGTGVDPVGYWSDAYAIAVDAPNLDNAYGYINYMMSPEANAAMAKATGSGCTIEKALPLLPEDMQSAYPYDNVRTAGGGILASQNMMPPQEASGDIVAASAWADAWEKFKLA